MRRLNLAATAACALLFSFQAQSATYVVHATQWGAAQDGAVASAGGTVRFSHGDSGVAVVDSANPQFLAQVKAGGAITGGGTDLMVQWQKPQPQIQAVNTSNDRFFPLQWAPTSIDAQGAWAAGWTGAGVRVAVIDGGLNPTHPDMGNAVDVARSRSFVRPLAVDDGMNACRITFACDFPSFWHGAHVAGIIAARDNATGVVGIAPEATIISVKALHGGSGSFGAVISAIAYAATPVADGGAGASILNMSLGAVFPKNGDRSTGDYANDLAQLRVALKKAVDYASKRALVIVATGNDSIRFDGNNYTSVPAESGDTLAVAATGPEGFALGATNFAAPASYSNYGNTISGIAGPGGDFRLPGNAPCTMATHGASLTRPCWVFDMVMSTVESGYGWSAGTSMAAPAVAAVAALIKQKNPGFTPAQVRKQLLKSATPMAPSFFYGAGYVNAARAVAD